jgi:competence protein ComEA
MSVKSFVFAIVLSILSLPSFADVVNINKANAVTFQYYLKGIGLKKANSIINYRTEHKEFKTIEEIKEVRGIGDKIFNTIKKNLSLTKGVVSLQTSEETDVKKTPISKKKATAEKKLKKKSEKNEEKKTETETDTSGAEYL